MSKREIEEKNACEKV